MHPLLAPNKQLGSPSVLTVQLFGTYDILQYSTVQQSTVDASLCDEHYSSEVRYGASLYSTVDQIISNSCCENTAQVN